MAERSRQGRSKEEAEAKAPRALEAMVRTLAFILSMKRSHWHF